MRQSRFVMPCLAVPLFLFMTAWYRLNAAEPETVRVGVALAFTGEFSRYGLLNMAGIRLFTDEWNRKAEENGFRMELVVQDTKSDPVTAAGLVDVFADMGDVPVIIGPVTSLAALYMTSEARERSLPLISPAATNPAVGAYKDWVFRVQPGEDYQGRGLARFFREGLKAKVAAAVVNTRYDYGAMLAESFRMEFLRRGGEQVLVETIDWDFYESGPFDFSEIIERVRTAAPEVVLLSGFADEAIAFIQQASEVGWQPVYCGGDSWLNPAILHAAGAGLDDSYYVGSAELTREKPEPRRFLELLEASDDKDLETYSVYGYDAALITAAALQSGARTGPAIRDWLYSREEFPLVSGVITSSRETGIDKTLSIYRISRMGENFFSELVRVMEPEKGAAVHEADGRE